MGNKFNYDKYFSKGGIFTSNERLLLRSMRGEDKNAYMSLKGETLPELSSVRKHSPETVKYMEDFILGNLDEGDELHIAVIDRATKEYTADIVFMRPDSSTPEIGYEVLKKWQRHGIAYESVKMANKAVCRNSPCGFFSA